MCRTQGDEACEVEWVLTRSLDRGFGQHPHLTPTLSCGREPGQSEGWGSAGRSPGSSLGASDAAAHHRLVLPADARGQQHRGSSATLQRGDPKPSGGRENWLTGARASLWITGIGQQAHAGRRVAGSLTVLLRCLWTLTAPHRSCSEERCTCLLPRGGGGARHSSHPHLSPAGVTLGDAAPAGFLLRCSCVTRAQAQPSLPGQRGDPRGGGWVLAQPGQPELEGRELWDWMNGQQPSSVTGLA